MRPDPKPHPGINLTRINPSGWVGLVFTVGVVFMFFVALPQIRWFFLLSLPAGALVGAVLVLIHRR